MRLKELRELKWNQISDPKHLTNDRQKRINRSIFFPATKTSRQRTIISPISFLIDDLVELYHEIGVNIDRSSDRRIFFNIFSRSFDESTWYSETTMTRKLDALLVECGLYDKLSKENPARRITLNSGRHYFATNAYSVSNGDILAVSKLMRHASPATTAIYAELASPVAKQVVNAMQTPGIE
jgi:integrase